MVFFSLFFCEVMNLGPMIVPRHKFLLFHLLRKKVIDGAAKG